MSKMSHVHYNSYQSSWWLKVAHQMASIFPGPIKGWSTSNISDLLALPRQKLGLNDYGAFFFQEGLDALVKAVFAEKKISPIGRIIIKKSILDYLTNRLLIQETIRCHPDILLLKIQRPLFIVGLNRTGTTMLHNLLALAPDARGPRTWELIQPAPPCQPDSREARHRISRARGLLRLLQCATAGLKIIHPMEATDIEECYPLINNTFTSPAFLMHYGLSSYADWLKEVDIYITRWVYREYLTQLKILQSTKPHRRWILKSAVHLYFLDALLEEIPDALIVQTHRDPLQMIPSICSLASCFRNLICATQSPENLGLECLDIVKETLIRGYKAREKHNKAQILDIDFDELITDPISQVYRIHEYFNLDWEVSHEKQMQKWLISHPPPRRGQHHYSMAQFGLNQDMIISAMSYPSIHN